MLISYFEQDLFVLGGGGIYLHSQHPESSGRCISESEVNVVYRVSSRMAKTTHTHKSCFKNNSKTKQTNKKFSCLVQPWYEGFWFVLLYLDWSCLAVISWRSALFLKMKSRAGWEERYQKNGGRENWLGYVIVEKNLLLIKNK